MAILDVLELIVISKHHKLSEIRPALRQQKEAVVKVWKQEKEEIKREIENLVARNRNQQEQRRRGRPMLDLNEEADYEREQRNQQTYEDDPIVDFDKDQIYEILEQAGVQKRHMDLETRRKLPTWTRIQQLYGTEPKMYGLERCEAFTSSVEPSISFFGIAGMFNSGTNLLAELLIQNCQIVQRMRVFGTEQRGIRWQVPWGKHTPVRYRHQHVTDTDIEIPPEHSFPMITIRDPYRWMQSMCKHSYGARWPHNKTTCPNIQDADDWGPTPVFVKYAENRVRHHSLPEMWNDWYNEYFAEDFPRVFVRFEDLLFYGKNVTQTLCKCGGGVPRRDHFVHVRSSAKLGTAAHGSNKTGLLDALIQFGTDEGRLKGYTKKDLELSHQFLDPKLMTMFDYSYAMDY